MSDEKRLSELEESVRQVNTKLEEATKRADEAEAKFAESEKRADRAEDALRLSEARSKVAEVAKEKGKGLPDRAIERAVDAALAESLPVTDGKLDTDKLAERAEKAVKDEREYLTEAGSGRVSGMGGTAAAADSSDELAEAFQDLGLDEKAAKLAAEGR